MTVFEQLKESAANSPDQGNRLRDDEIKRTIEYYETEIASRTHGPQLEGIESASLEAALRDDPNVILIEVQSKASETIKWPLLTPIEHHIDYSRKFFDEHYPDRPTYTLSLPPYSSIEELRSNVDIFAPIAERLKQEKAVIAYDYLEGGENSRLIPEFLNEMLADVASLQDVTPESMLGGASYGLPKVVHFEGYLEPANAPEFPVSDVQGALVQMVRNGEIEENPQSGVAYFTAEKLKANDGELLKQIWKIYSDQFDTLTEDHPSLQKQPQEELERMLAAEDAINIAYMEEGKVAGLLYLVHDIANCVWLNKKFYDDRYPDDKGWLAYYPGVVVAKERARQGAGYAQAMIGCLADTVGLTGNRIAITCQCTNVSMTYVPKIVASVLEANPKLRMIHDNDGEAFTQTADYEYRVVQVT